MDGETDSERGGAGMASTARARSNISRNIGLSFNTPGRYYRLDSQSLITWCDIVGSGIYEIDPNGRPCFRPRAPGFPRLEDILDALDPAVAAVREFERVLAGWQAAGVIGRLFARLDAVHSSGAEGSTTTFTDLLEYESSRRTAADPDDAATVAACAEAFEAEATGTGDPIDMTMAIHRRLFDRSRDRMVASTAGKLKERTNGTADPEAPGGFFYYTQPASVPQALVEWRDFTLSRDPRTP